MFSRASPVARFVVVVLLILAAALFGTLGTIEHLSERSRLEGDLRNNARIQADQLAASLALPVWNFDQSQIVKIAESEIDNREVGGVVIRMHDVSSGSGFRTYGLVRNDGGEMRVVSDDSMKVPSGDVMEERPLLANGETVGSVKVFYTPYYLEQELRNNLFSQVMTFLGFGVILAAGLYLLLWRTVLRPLGVIEQYAGEVSSGGTGQLASGGRFRGELERLRGSVEKMVELLAARYESLKQKEDTLAQQLRFEELVTSISSQMVAAQPQNLQHILERVLGDIARLLDADRVVLGRIEDETGDMIPYAYFRLTEPAFPARLAMSQRYPALWKLMCEGQTSLIRDVSRLAEEVAVDRGHFAEVGIQSQVTAPVMVDGQLKYVLAVATVGHRATWSDQAVSRIKVIAEVLATTAFRCEAEEVVRSSERQFRTFIEQAPVPIILVPSPDGAPLYFNPAFTRIFGFTLRDISRPEDWWPMIYPDPEYREERHQAWAKITALATETGSFQDAEEAAMSTKSGDVRFAEVRLTIIGGYRMSFINDITARREAESALRMTQYAVDNNPLMIFRLDMEGRFAYANVAACSQFGYSAEEIKHLHIWDIARTVTAADWAARAAHFRTSGSSTIESVYVTRSGHTFPVEVRIQYIEFSNDRQFFTYAYDISERISAREAEQAYTRRIQKLATELTRSEERQRRELATILHDGVGQNLFAATTQLLTIRTREESARPEVEKAIELLNQVTRDTRDLTFELCPPVLYQLGLMPALERLAARFTANYGIACSISGSSAGPVDLNSRGLAYQAVRELLNNIAKHARARKVTIAVAEMDGYATIEVVEDGAGFDPAQLRPGKNGAEGGFGLFHMRERVELLGGSMKIESAPGNGSRVQLSLPLNILQLTE